MNGLFDHYQVVIRRSMKQVTPNNSVKVILGALSQPLHHVDVQTSI